MTVKRRFFIRAISFLSAIAVALAAGGLAAQKAKASYEETLGKVRLVNLTSLCEFSRDISAGLRLLAVSADDALTDSTAYVRAKAMGAVGCLNSFDSEKAKNISAFFNGTHSFAEDFTGSEAQRKAAVILSDYAQSLYYHLNDVTAAVMDGEYSLTEYSSIYSADELPYFENFLDFKSGSENEIFEIITPTSVQAGSGNFFDGKEKISENEARSIAGKAAGITPALWRENEAFTIGIEVYSFAHGDVAAEVCKSGGQLCRLVNPQPCNQALYSYEDAESAALEFAKKHGYTGLTVTAAKTNEFTADFSLFPEVDGVLLLTSRIEVSVCLASGKITYFDASEYIRNYRENVGFNTDEPDLSKILPNNLALQETVNCLVNIDGRERMCCLAVCYFEGDTVLAFVDSFDLKVLKTKIIYDTI